jgi:hypothetical protein
MSELAESFTSDPRHVAECSMEARPGRHSANDITGDNRVNPEIRDPTIFLSRPGSAPEADRFADFPVCVLVTGPRAGESLDEADATKRDYILASI